ncbi:hypothetical protein C6P40_001583 [Pichia californica]|uniref:Brl1/Brr6 domain-containing protein n=1 Tax=Pichia californica TaxID=460514 RepID=A0A9P6WIU2_9ASCO|nr:hypothetical protein C6P42_001548 [[Candida] californica]KAG0687945.1 hypothetical protein C6P40_001583 [[Candida] californica]
MDDESILNALRSSLRLNSNENNNTPRIFSQQGQVYNDNNNSDDDDMNLSDGDITMKDYTEDELEMPLNLQQQFENNDIKVDHENNSQNYDSVEDDKQQKIIRGKSKSLIRTLLQPEEQGYLFGVMLLPERKTHNNSINYEDSEPEITENRISLRYDQENKNRSELINNDAIHPIKTISGKHDDRNIIIHNHYYNIITPNHHEFNDTYIPDDNYYQNSDKGKKNNTEYGRIDQEYYRRSTFVFENLKNVINYSILISLVTIIILRLHKDIGIEYNNLIIRERFQQEQCMNEYYENRCDINGQLPALKDDCLEWKICFSSGNTAHFKKVFYSELCMRVIGRLINETLNNIGGRNKMFLVIVLVVWYIGNFMYGYARSQERNKEIHYHNHNSDIQQSGVSPEEENDNVDMLNNSYNGNYEMVVRSRKSGGIR